MAEVTGSVKAWQGSVTGLNLNVPGSTSGTPIGPAGGSLGGTYPNPTVVTNANLTGPVTSVGNATAITATGVAAATYGNSTQVGQFTVNAAGQITAASNVSIAGLIGALTGVATPNNANAAAAGVALNALYRSTLDPAVVYQRTV